MNGAEVDIELAINQAMACRLGGADPDHHGQHEDGKPGRCLSQVTEHRRRAAVFLNKFILPEFRRAFNKKAIPLTHSLVAATCPEARLSLPGLLMPPASDSDVISRSIAVVPNRAGTC